MGYWKKKPLDQRFSDTYQFIQQRMGGVPNLDVCLAMTDLRLAAMEDDGSLEELLKLMSLGFRWELKKSDAETRRRHYVRAVLLGYGALGDPAQGGRRLSVPQVQQKKAATEAMTEQALDLLLRQMLTAASRTEGGRSFVGFDTTLETQNAVWALDQIVEATTRVQMALGTVGRVAPAAALFATWFGNSNPATVRSNFAKVERGVRGGVVLIKDPSPARNNVFGYVYPDGPNDPPRIYLCNAFWRAGRVTWRNNGGVTVRVDNRREDDNPLGVLLHELTHIFCRTEDHEYGKTACRALATNSPALAVTNSTRARRRRASWNRNRSRNAPARQKSERCMKNPAARPTASEVARTVSTLASTGMPPVVSPPAINTIAKISRGQ